MVFAWPVEIDVLDVLDLIRDYRAEPDPLVRAGMYYALVCLDLVADDPEPAFVAPRPAQRA